MRRGETPCRTAPTFRLLERGVQARVPKCANNPCQRQVKPPGKKKLSIERMYCSHACVVASGRLKRRLAEPRSKEVPARALP